MVLYTTLIGFVYYRLSQIPLLWQGWTHYVHMQRAYMFKSGRSAIHLIGCRRNTATKTQAAHRGSGQTWPMQVVSKQEPGSKGNLHSIRSSCFLLCLVVKPLVLQKEGD